MTAIERNLWLRAEDRRNDLILVHDDVFADAIVCPRFFFIWTADCIHLLQELIVAFRCSLDANGGGVVIIASIAGSILYSTALIRI